MNLFCKHLGHNYQARYSSHLAGPLSSKGGVSVATIEALKTKVYHCDVCARCGDIINKQQKG